MRDNVISIDIGTYSTKVIVGRRQNNNILVEKAFSFTTPPNSINDGKILDTGLLKSELLNNINKNKIRTRKVIYTFESTAIIRRELELPMVKAEDMDTMIRYEVEQYLPIVLSDYIIEYKLLEEFKEDDVKKCRISVAALPKAIAEDYLKLTKDLKFTPIALDINSNAVAKLFMRKAQINGKEYNIDKTAAIIDYGHSCSNLVISARGIPRLNRLLNVGGLDTDTMIANSFGLDLEGARQKRELVKRLLQKENEEGLSLLEQTALQSVDGWLTELQRLFQFYNSRGNDNIIDEIYLYGEGSELGGLPEYVSATMNIPAVRLEKHSRIKLGKAAASIDISNYMNAIGAIMQE